MYATSTGASLLLPPSTTAMPMTTALTGAWPVDNEHGGVGRGAEHSWQSDKRCTQHCCITRAVASLGCRQERRQRRGAPGCECALSIMASSADQKDRVRPLNGQDHHGILV